MRAQAALMLGAGALTKSSTGVMKGGKRRASSAARWAVTYRGLASYMTKPTASAPAATAASTSSSRVRPQILMRVRRGGAEVISPLSTDDCSGTLHSSRGRGTGFAGPQAQRPPRGAANHAKRGAWGLYFSWQPIIGCCAARDAIVGFIDGPQEIQAIRGKRRRGGIPAACGHHAGQPVGWVDALPYGDQAAH